MSRRTARTGDTSSDYARAHLDEDGLSLYARSVFEFVARGGEQSRPEGILALRVLAPTPGALHVFDDPSVPGALTLHRQISDRKRFVEEKNRGVKGAKGLKNGDKLVSLLRADHVVQAQLPSPKEGLPPFWVDGVSTAPAGTDPATAFEHFHLYPRGDLPSTVISEAKASKGAELLAVLRRPDANPAGPGYRHMLPDGVTSVTGPMAYDLRYHIHAYIKEKTPVKEKAPAAPEEAAAAAAGAPNPIFALREGEAGSVVQAEAPDFVPAVYKLSSYHSPFDREAVLDITKPRRTFKIVMAFSFVLRDGELAARCMKDVHARTGIAMTTQTADTVIEQIRSDIETTRADDVIDQAAYLQSIRVASVYLEDYLDEDFRGHIIVRVLYHAAQVAAIEEGDFPAAVGRTCAFTGKRIETPQAVKVLAYLDKPVPGVLEKPGWISVFCRPTYEYKDMRSKAAVAAEEKAAAEAAAAAAAKEAKDRAEKEKEQGEVDAMDIDEPPAAATTTTTKPTPYLVPDEWNIPLDFVLQVTPALRNLLAAAEAAGPSDVDTHIRTYLATKPDAKLIGAANAALRAAVAKTAPVELVVGLEQFLHKLAEGEVPPYALANYVNADEAPVAGAVAALAYVLTDVFATVPADQKARFKVPSTGPYSPVHLAMARVLFCPLSI